MNVFIQVILFQFFLQHFILPINPTLEAIVEKKTHHEPLNWTLLKFHSLQHQLKYILIFYLKELSAQGAQAEKTNYL